MTTFKSFNNIVLDMINYLQLTQPSLDVKPGAVSRDLFIDAQAQQISNIYTELQKISALQSISNVSGQDLVNYASNFGITKQTGTKAIGKAVLTLKTVDTDIIISQNSVIRNRNGFPFLTVSTTTITTSQANALRATATRFRQELNSVGITDEFAIEVSVQAQSNGSAGNISAYSLVSQSVSGISNVTNISPFTGGTDAESDSSFRTRILSTFAGTNVGTAVGYRSTILNLADAIDALVIEPGDPLMIRDGTDVSTDSNGNLIVTQPGTGGKIDIYVMGENPQSGIDSFVYYDQSGTNNPADADNYYIMGQSSTTASTTLTLNSRRVSTLAGTASIPNQPISNIISVSGSSSGPNFIEQYLDTDGTLKGNYKLIKDTGSASGSSFGLDRFAWTSDRINLLDEANTKGVFNSIDSLGFTDVSLISDIIQEVQVINENSTVSGSSRSYITVKHSPIKTVSRVFNTTTGERYTIVDQNPDGTGTINETGRIQISGRTLPTVSDILQVDYIWLFNYDQYIDFDNFNPKDDLDSAQDSVEWGYSNYIRDEVSVAILDAYNNLTVTTIYPISRVLSVNTYVSETATVSSTKTIIVSQTINNIYNITDTTLSGGPEIYNTKTDDGDFSNLLIILPTDTLAQAGDTVIVTYNLDNIATSDDYDSGLFVNNMITILPYTAVSSGTTVKVNYVANLSNILPSIQVATLPVSGNTFNSFIEADGYQPVLNTFSGTTVVANQRRAPSNLEVSLTNIPVSGGSIRISGNTFNKIEGVVTITTADIIDFSTLIKTKEGISRNATLSSNISIVRVALVQKVTLNVSAEVSNIIYIYDLTNYSLYTNIWDKANALENTSLSQTQMALSQTSYNTESALTTGTKLQVIFYYVKINDYEDLYFSRSGRLITNKKFGYVSSINRLSGLQDSGGTISGNIQIDNFNQPKQNETYLTDYEYTAPKENERITINYEYNKLITDATEAIEDKRPITADVLVKAAVKIELDVTANIVISSDFQNQSSTVIQDVADNITSTLTATALGTILDASDIINNIYNVAGVDRVNIIRFNKHNISGTKLSLSAQKNEYFAPGTVSAVAEER
jgi:hypothetical protein